MFAFLSVKWIIPTCFEFVVPRALPVSLLCYQVGVELSTDAILAKLSSTRKSRGVRFGGLDGLMDTMYVFSLNVKPLEANCLTC